MASTPQTVLCRYHYDALNRLAACSPAGVDDLQRFYQKSRLTTHIQGQIQRSIMLTEDQLLAQRTTLNGQTNGALLATDQQGSVLIGVQSTQQHAVAYTPYGYCRPQPDLPGFNGEQADPVTGYYLLGNGYRAFNPLLMRFNSPDSLSPFGQGGLNAYAYCAGDPVNFNDPLGHSIFSVVARAASRFVRAISRRRVVPPSRPGSLVGEQQGNLSASLTSVGRGPPNTTTDSTARMVVTPSSEKTPAWTARDVVATSDEVNLSRRSSSASELSASGEGHVIPPSGMGLARRRGVVIDPHTSEMAAFRERHGGPAVINPPAQSPAVNPPDLPPSFSEAIRSAEPVWYGDTTELPVYSQAMAAARAIRKTR